MAAITQYATGKRKSAIARAWVTAAAGDIVVNEKPLEKAFPRMTLRNVIQFPFELAGVAGKYSVRATVYGGGPAFRSPLKKEGLLTRDSRVKERKKYGQKGARKHFQYSKR